MNREERRQQNKNKGKGQPGWTQGKPGNAPKGPARSGPGGRIVRQTQQRGGAKK